MFLGMSMENVLKMVISPFTGTIFQIERLSKQPIMVNSSNQVFSIAHGKTAKIGKIHLYGIMVNMMSENFKEQILQVSVELTFACV